MLLWSLSVSIASFLLLSGLAMLQQERLLKSIDRHKSVFRIYLERGRTSRFQVLTLELFPGGRQTRNNEKEVIFITLGF